MNLAKKCLLFALFSAFSFLLPAQNILISYTKSDSLFVCGTDTFSITVQNNHPVLLTGATLVLSLPDGVGYAPGSVSGAIELNIGNLSTPSFTLSNIGVNQSVTIKILISADCAAADVLDAGQLFIADIAVQTPLGNAQTSTTSIPVETGAIVIESVSGQLLSGELGDTLLRTICVRNTRLGKIARLHFEDSHLEGFLASVAGASGQTATNTFYSAHLEGPFFEAVGNGDAWLDLNESVCFTERIVLTSCGIPMFVNESVLRVGWGCGIDVCRYDSATAFVEIKPSTKVPDLVIDQIWSPPIDYCGTTPVTMGFKIRNIGKVAAQNVVFNLSLIEGLSQAGMVPGSFRISTNNGVTPIVPSTANPTPLVSCGMTALNEAFFSIPLVPAKDSIEFLFDVLTCVDSCEQVQPAFRADYFYQKSCPPNGFVSAFALVVPEDRYVVSGDVVSNIGTCLKPGQTYPFAYEAVSRYLSEPGFWHLTLELPLGITLNDSCGTLLGGVPPVLHETTPLANGGQSVHLAWETPMSADSLRMDFCLKFVCDTNIVCEDLPAPQGGGVIYTDYCCFSRMKDVTYWTPALQTVVDCGISECGERLLALDLQCGDQNPGGPGDTAGMAPIIPTPGLRDWWNVYRTNVDFEDANDDRLADLPLFAPASQARRDRFLAGDTLRVEYCAVMDSATTVDTIGRAIWHEIVGSDMGNNDLDIFQTVSAQNEFANASKFRLLGTHIRVRYADGTEATCPWSPTYSLLDRNYFLVANPNAFPIEPIDDIATQRHFFLYSLPAMFAEGCLPKPMLELGDSIFILTDFKLDLNFRPNSTNNPDPPLVGFRTASSAGGGIFAWNIQPRKNLQYSGWKKYVSPNTNSVKPCENSTETKKFRYSMRIARENMFPFEVRPLARISDYRQTFPSGLEVGSAKLEYLVLQDSVPVLSNLDLPFSQTPGFFALDFSPAFSQPVDEGFTLRSNLRIKPNCQFNLPDTSKQYIETSFTGCLNGDNMTVLDSIKNSIGYFSNTPELQLLTSDSIVYAPSRAFELDFQLKNTLVSAAPSAWVAIVSPSGQATNFELFQMPQNQAVVGTNGLYNLNNINGFNQKNYRLKGQNTACETDTLLLIFGWGCTPISSLSEPDCGRDTSIVELHLERPELELKIEQEPDAFLLCDTSEYFEFEVFNAKIGYAYEVEASAKLPPGLQIVSGTCQISYPEGSPWANIPDPLLLPGNFYQWPLSQILPTVATNGLPSVSLAPLNSFHLRFKTLAECGFVANTPIVYGTVGTEPCGRQANSLNKPGEPLIINGLSPSYGVQISLQPQGDPGETCGDVQGFSVTLSILGTPSAGDSVYVSLPQGVLLLLNSYMPGQNAPSGPWTLSPQGFQLPLPILSGGGTVQFGFQVQLDAEAGCNDPVLIVQTRVRTEAFCQSLGMPCEVYLATGEATWNIDPAHSELTATQANLFIMNGQVNGSVTVSNIGTVAVNGATVQIWRDVDGDGTLSANDVLLEALQTSATLPAGGSVQLSGVLANLDSAQLCGLLLVLPANENCACDDQVLPLENISLQHTALIYCDLQAISLGISEQIGFSYQWQPSADLACANCANTIYTPTLPHAQTLTLTETGPGCTVTHTFEVSFGSMAQIMVGNTVICAGQSTVLVATPANGAAYFWQGPGIQNPNQQAQTVQPGANSTYFVTITLSNGCMAIDTANIQVLPADTTHLAGLGTCVGEPVDVLGNLTATPGTYQILLGNAHGCDSLVFQTLSVWPNILVEEQYVFCSGDSLLVRDSLFTASGTLSLTFPSVHGCDSTYLVTVVEKDPPALITLDTIFGTFGQIITLTAPNGYVTYHWEPMPEPPCTNCPMVTYPADSVGYQEYLLRVSGTDGCPGELVFRVVVFPPCSADSLRIPNAFTPNGDGANDVFQVVEREGGEVVSGLEIYDRWGEKVYENRGNSFWDGTIDGKPAPSDVYVYIVSVQCGELLGKRVGDVTLLR